MSGVVVWGSCVGYVVEVEELVIGSCRFEEEVVMLYIFVFGGGESLEGGWDSMLRGVVVLFLW